MSHELLLNGLWQTTVSRLGGVAAIAASAREKRAFLRPREVKSATDLLRLILAYCLGGMGLRSTSAWAASAGLADPRLREDRLFPMWLCCSACATAVPGWNTS